MPALDEGRFAVHYGAIELKLIYAFDENAQIGPLLGIVIKVTFFDSRLALNSLPDVIATVNAYDICTVSVKVKCTTYVSHLPA